MSILKERGFWALALAGLIFFHRPLFFDATFFFRDLHLYFIPIKHILVEVLRAGEWPLWNPYLHGGLPLLADLSSAVLYPTFVLYLVLPVPTALTLELVIHVLASAAALYVLARRLGLSQPSAVLAGAVYGYCGYTLSQVNIYMRLLPMPYLPLMLLCWHAYLRPVDTAAEGGRRSRRRWLAGLAALGALQVLAGSPEMVAFTWLTLLAWGLCQSPARLSAGRRARCWLLAGMAAAGLAAPQLLPLVEMAGQSRRGAGLEGETFGHWSLDPRRSPELVLPGFLGRTDVLEPGAYWGAGIVDSGFPYVLSLYLGALVLALAAAAVAYRSHGVLPRRISKLLLFLSLLAVVLSFGRFLPFFDLGYRWVPGVQLFRYPIKFLTLAILPMALLAGQGAEILARAPRRRQRIVLRAGWLVTFAAAALLLLWVTVPAFAAAVQQLFFGDAGPRIEHGLLAAWLHMAAVWLAATLAYQLAALRPGGWFPWALAGLVALDLMLGGRRLNPTVPPAMITEVPPAAVLVSEHLGDGRFYRSPGRVSGALQAPSAGIEWLNRWARELLRFYLASFYGIPVIFHDDYNGLAPRRVMRLKWTVEAVPWHQRLPLLSAGAVRVFITEDDLDEPGVEKLGTIFSSSRPVHVYRNDRAAERVTLVTAYVRALSEDEAVSAMLAPGFDPRQHAVVEGEVPEAATECRGPGRAVVREESLHRRSIAVTNACPGLLVLSEVHYPGWRVRLDGSPAPLLRANAAFSAVWLPPGEHDVEWTYVPRSLHLSLLISGLTLGGLIWIGRRRS